jgi:hypothetical protein
MDLFTKDEITSVNDVKYEDVLVPEWGPDKGVRLKSLTGTERDNFEASSIIQKGSNARMNLVNMRARLLALCIVDANGKRMFADVEVNKLGQRNANVLERLFTKAQEMNGMTDKDVEELTEGFTPDQSEDSISSSL